MSRRAPLALALVMGVALFVLGCGGRGATTAPPVRVGGTIYLDGQPLEDALIVFIPESGQQANGVSGSGGKYRLTTRNTGDGAVPGSYKVTVKKGGGAGDTTALKPGTPEYDAKMKSMMGAKGPPKNSSMTEGGIHVNYTDPGKTPLKFDVPSGGNTSLDINLTSQGT